MCQLSSTDSIFNFFRLLLFTRVACIYISYFFAFTTEFSIFFFENVATFARDHNFRYVFLVKTRRMIVAHYLKTT